MYHTNKRRHCAVSRLSLTPAWSELTSPVCTLTTVHMYTHTSALRKDFVIIIGCLFLADSALFSRTFAPFLCIKNIYCTPIHNNNNNNITPMKNTTLCIVHADGAARTSTARAHTHSIGGRQRRRRACRSSSTDVVDVLGRRLHGYFRTG